MYPMNFAGRLAALVPKRCRTQQVPVFFPPDRTLNDVVAPTKTVDKTVGGVRGRPIPDLVVSGLWLQRVLTHVEQDVIDTTSHRRGNAQPLQHRPG